jgi:hypothetical protein
MFSIVIFLVLSKKNKKKIICFNNPPSTPGHHILHPHRQINPQHQTHYPKQPQSTAKPQKITNPHWLEHLSTNPRQTHKISQTHNQFNQKIERNKSDLIGPPRHHREALVGRDEREA